VASLIRESVRQGEIACRYDKDQFLLYVPNIEQIEAEKIMNRIVLKISKQTFHLDESVKLRLFLHSSVMIVNEPVSTLQRELQRIPYQFELLHDVEWKAIERPLKG